MASKTAVLAIKIISDAKQAGEGLKNTAAKLEALDSKTRAVGKYTGAATAAWGALAKKSFDAASEMQQASGAVEAVFKNQTEAVMNAADNAAQAVGLSAAEYSNFSALMGAQLKNMGVAQKDLAPTTETLITQAADLASMFGGTTADAVGALSAALRGETDPIERYGISIKQADINARLAAEGLDKLEGEEGKAAKTRTLLKMITEQSADAHGNFAREAATAAGQQQRAAAEWENAKAKLGEQLLPVVSEGARLLGSLASEVGKHPGAFKAFGIAAGVATAAIYGITTAVKAYIASTKAIAGVKAAWSAVHKAMHLEAVAAHVKSATAAVVNAAKAAAAWVAQKARVVASFVATAAAAALHYGAAAATAVAQSAIAAAAWVASNTRAVASFVLLKGAMIASKAATAAMAAGQAALNLMMNANPIGLVVTALGALAAGLVYAYRHSESFRNAVDAAGRVGMQAFHRVTDAVRGGIDWVKGLGDRMGWVRETFKHNLSIAKRWVERLFRPFERLIDLIGQVIDWSSSIRFPSPPSWVRDVMGSAAMPDLVGITRDTDHLLRFLPPAPDITAARYSPPAWSGRINRPSTSGGTGSVTVNIAVKGAVVADKVELADYITSALRRKGVADLAL